jgi:hypothetical protein
MVSDTGCQCKIFLGIRPGIAYKWYLEVIAVIESGAQVIVRDARGQTLSRRAITGVVPGHDFPIVWVCKEEEWLAAQSEGREPEGVPWPAEDVTAVAEASA